jgi:hypothetical protein
MGPKTTLQCIAMTVPKFPRLLTHVRDIRPKHYSIRMKQAYVNWIKRFICSHDKHSPAIWDRQRSNYS